MELAGIRPGLDGSTCHGDLGSGLVSQLPCLGGTLGIVGGKNVSPLCELLSPFGKITSKIPASSDFSLILQLSEEIFFAADV